MTWARLIFLVASVINVALRLFGAENAGIAENAATIIILIISSLSAYWKNNSFTEAAQAADAILAALKRADKQ